MAKKSSAKVSRAPQDQREVATFEQALERLGVMVQQLENGQIGLTESLEYYEQGVSWLRICYELLEEAERRVSLLVRVDEEGNAVLRKFADDELDLQEKSASRSRRRSHQVDSAEDKADVDEDPGLF